MSKRYIFPQQQNDRKKARLDVTISDHNFPLSQNVSNKDADQNNWGDDNDDEILLLASQACEDVYNDLSSLPDYSVCMQPRSTSTQMFDPGPSTSKTNFSFKKPTEAPPTFISSNLKDKCTRISSPLPGMSSKMLPKPSENIDITDDLIFNDKIYKGQDSDFLYKQLLQLQEENNKLKSENGKLLEKCVTKEGEASILRTQLKTCQMAVDNARMDKIKAQEKVQMEWTEKLTAANSQVHELRTQLDFKNLEIISIKERCKMLESTKVKLTQVMVTGNDISMSQRNNSNIHNMKDIPSPMRRVKMTSNAVQTEDKAPFLKLNKSYRSDPQKLSEIIPLVLQPTTDQHSILEYNEKLQQRTDLSHNKCRVYSTFHRIPTTPGSKQLKRVRSDMTELNNDLTRLAVNDDDQCFGNILAILKRILEEVHTQLEQVSRKVSTAFQREMDERYIDASANYIAVGERDLLQAKPLYKEEQSVVARRMTAVVCCTLKCGASALVRSRYDAHCAGLLELLQAICTLLDRSYCALLYSGLLLSATYLIEESNLTEDSRPKIIDLIKTIILSRPMPFVACHVLKVMRKLSLDKDFMGNMCPGGSVGNLRLDYDQGVLLFKKDSCHLQILLKQIESALKCIEKQGLSEQAAVVTAHLIALYSNVSDSAAVVDKERMAGCDCQLVLLQGIVYALRICAAMLQGSCPQATGQHARLLSACRSGVRVLYQCVVRDVEFSSQLHHSEGYLLHFAEILSGFQHQEGYVNMLSEISGAFQPSPEEAPPAFHRQPWLRSFDNFSIAD